VTIRLENTRRIGVCAELERQAAPGPEAIESSAPHFEPVYRWIVVLADSTPRSRAV